VRFAVWAIVGAFACLSVVGALTIGIFVGPIVAVMALGLALTTPIDRSIAGAVSGMSATLFYVAWLNRGGPGDVCRKHADFTQCDETWSPWPWLSVGFVLLTVGLALFYWLGRVRRAA
jgi:hypothetical protein